MAASRFRRWPGTPRARCWLSALRTATPGCWNSRRPGQALVPAEPCALPAVDTHEQFRGWNDMPAEDRQHEFRREMLLASMLIAAGLAASALALTALTARDSRQIAPSLPPGH